MELTTSAALLAAGLMLAISVYFAVRRARGLEP